METLLIEVQGYSDHKIWDGYQRLGKKGLCVCVGGWVSGRLHRWEEFLWKNRSGHSSPPLQPHLVFRLLEEHLDERKRWKKGGGGLHDACPAMSAGPVLRVQPCRDWTCLGGSIDWHTRSNADVFSALILYHITSHDIISNTCDEPLSI